MKITVCMTFFKSLELENFHAALYSLSRQDLSQVENIVVVDNDTEFAAEDIRRIVRTFTFSVPTMIFSIKHGNPTRTHAWSTNVAAASVETPWIFFTRADYILDFDVVRKFISAADADEDQFITGNVYHLNANIATCDSIPWRQEGPRILRDLPGTEEEYTSIDAGVWLARKAAFDRVGGLDEGLTAWGHAQTVFQHRLYESGTRFIRIPEVLFYHPQHAAPRDIVLAHTQLRERGIDLKRMWRRYEGVSPY